MWRAIWLLLICTSISRESIAEGALMLAQSGYLSTNQETERLSPNEIERLQGIRARPSTLSANLASMSPAALQSNTVTMALPDGTTIRVTRVRGAQRSGTTLSWTGRAASGATAEMTTNGKYLFGLIQTSHHSYTILQFNEELQVIIENNQQYHRPDDPSTD